MDQEGVNITIRFQPVPLQLINMNSCQEEAGTLQPSSPEFEKPEFGPRLDTNSANFNLKNEIDFLPFQLSIRKDANSMQDQQSHFINLVYDNKEIFSLHDEDLGYCKQMKHIILMTMDKPVYLLHHTIPRQLQGEVHKWLDTWWQQGIIWPSKSHYASQVVIVHKKLGDIHLCIDYPKLNSITVRDAFPLPKTDKGLQAVHSSNWFTSFTLAQGYLQLAMEEDNVKKTALRTRSSGLYKFTCMPFGLSNAGTSFSHLMEQCLRDQQFVILLLYLDNISIFAPSTEVMLDWLELLFNRLKEYHLKIKPKNVISLTPVFCFWAIFYHLEEYLQTLRKSKRCGTGQSQQMQREYIPSQDLLPTIGGLCQNFTR